MKKLLYLFLALFTCITMMTACNFLGGEKDTTTSDSESTTEPQENDTEEEIPEDTDNDGEEVSVDDPDDVTTTENSDSDTASFNPRDNVAADSTKEYTATGKYCGFIDSSSVEIELSDGSYCSFFVTDEEVRSTLSALNEEDMPEISFTYKAKEGQINPIMISVIGG